MHCTEKNCPNDASVTYAFPWEGGEGAACPEHQIAVRFRAETLGRPIQFLPVRERTTQPPQSDELTALRLQLDDCNVSLAQAQAENEELRDMLTGAQNSALEQSHKLSLAESDRDRARAELKEKTALLDQLTAPAVVEGAKET